LKFDKHSLAEIIMTLRLRPQMRAATIAVLIVLAIPSQMRVWSQVPDDRVALANEVKQLHDARKSDAGIALARQAVARAEQTFGVDHVETASWRDILAEAHRLDGDWKRAEDLFRASLKMREQSLDASHPDIAVSLRNLAIVSWNYGDKEREAEDYFLRSLAIYERSLGPTYPRVATLVRELGILYDELGRADEATALYERVVAILEAAPDTAEVALATAINDLAVIYGYNKRDDDAALLHKRAHTIYARMLGPSHPHVATSLNNLAEQYRAQQRLAEARPLYEAAIAIYELALGPHHATVTRSMANLAESYDAQSLTHESAKVLERVRAIRQETFKETGVPHRLVTRHLWDLSLPAQVRGLYAQAEDLYVQEFHAMRYISIANGNALQHRRGDSQRFAFLEFVKIAWDLAKYGRDNTKLDETQHIRWP
jgi:tetratricopeptide (TPR) repeat protein